jgi:hypothetical protein
MALKTIITNKLNLILPIGLFVVTFAEYLFLFWSGTHRTTYEPLVDMIIVSYRRSGPGTILTKLLMNFLQSMFWVLTSIWNPKSGS